MTVAGATAGGLARVSVAVGDDAAGVTGGERVVRADTAGALSVDQGERDGWPIGREGRRGGEGKGGGTARPICVERQYVVGSSNARRRKHEHGSPRRRERRRYLGGGRQARREG